MARAKCENKFKARIVLTLAFSILDFYPLYRRFPSPKISNATSINYFNCRDVEAAISGQPKLPNFFLTPFTFSNDVYYHVWILGLCELRRVNLMICDDLSERNPYLALTVYFSIEYFSIEK